MLTLHCPPENVHALASFLREHGAEAVSVAALDYVYTRDNPLYAKLAAELDKRSHSVAVVNAPWIAAKPTTLAHLALSAAISLPKSGRRIRNGNIADLGELRLERGIGHACIDRRIELVDDCRRAIFRRGDAVPGIGFVTRHKIADQRHVGQRIGA